VAVTERNGIATRRMGEKARIIFVGAVSLVARDGTTGGQGFASRALLESGITSIVDWLLVDSSMRSHPPPPMPVRIADAIRRVGKVLYHLLWGRADGILVFSGWAMASMLEKGIMCVLSRIWGARVVLTLRSEITACHGAKRWFLRWALNSADVVICQSLEAGASLRELFPSAARRIRVVPNWIDTSQYELVWNERSARARDGREIVFLYMGWLIRAKGVEDLLEAAARLAARGAPFHLVICGGGPLRDALNHTCLRLGLTDRVEFRGWVYNEEKPAELMAADVIVLPSYSEGLPNSLLEGMACGLAVISTPVGGIPSLVTPSEGGLLVAPGDLEGLADAMETLAMDRPLAQAMGRRGRAHVVANFDIDHAWPQIAEALAVENTGMEKP